MKSRKGKEIEENPKASMLFFWAQNERQVRIEGTVAKMSKEESDVYFAIRSRESQIATWASVQSSVISNRSVLESRFARLLQEMENKDVKRPAWWGGYKLIPQTFEFWQGRPNRLNDRILYTKKNSEWQISRLSP